MQLQLPEFFGRIYSRPIDVLHVQAEGGGIYHFENTGKKVAPPASALIVEEVAHHHLGRIRIPEKCLERRHRNVIVARDEQEFVRGGGLGAAAARGARAELRYVLEEPT